MEFRSHTFEDYWVRRSPTSTHSFLSYLGWLTTFTPSLFPLWEFHLLTHSFNYKQLPSWLRRVHNLTNFALANSKWRKVVLTWNSRCRFNSCPNFCNIFLLLHYLLKTQILMARALRLLTLSRSFAIATISQNWNLSPSSSYKYQFRHWSIINLNQIFIFSIWATSLSWTWSVTNREIMLQISHVIHSSIPISTIKIWVVHSLIRWLVSLSGINLIATQLNWRWPPFSSYELTQFL